MSTRSAWVAVVFVIPLLSGCSKQAESAAARPLVPAAAVAPGRYPLTGEILRIDAARKVVVVRHDPIKDYMPAMTMEFAVAEGDLAIAQPGQRIRAELVPGKDGGDFRLEKIWPDERVAADTVAALALQLRQDTHARGKGAYREVGETVPDFALYDQSGRVVQSSRFRGKQIMLNFIFTRCPDPKMCPASTAKMIATQQLARAAGVTTLELVSITLDPAFDTPGVLREYASLRGIETANFSFLTGPETAIRDLLTQFGVIAQFKGDLLQHTLATLLIDANGKIAHRADGSAWEPQDFVARMKR
ncbi:SCO family protein [Horticoccus sp. 23ND18S-11]|uniref:SCO family protein n=1 Tax=Horticoccus sp. 23ND18S-11 TaxID=3391832 RepID=UPI0039C8FEF1